MTTSRLFAADGRREADSQDSSQQPGSVSTLELFFDLVFVFTLTQLTALLAADLSVTSAVRITLSFVVLYWMYAAYAWATNQMPPDRFSRQVLLICGMSAFLICALALPQAFGRSGVLFGIGYLLVVLIHSALYLRAFGISALRFCAVNIAAALALIVAGTMSGPVVYAVWLAVVLVHTVPPWLARRSTELDVRASHFVERHGLLLIVAFGESVIAIGVAVDSDRLGVGPVAGATLTLLLAAELWWVHFALAPGLAERTLQSTATADRVRVALGGYFYSFIPMLLGMVVLAAGVKKSLGHFTAPLTAPEAALLAGGVTLYLLGQVAFRLTLRAGLNWPQLIAGFAAAATIVIGIQVSAAAQLTALVVLVGLLCLLESRST